MIFDRAALWMTVLGVVVVISSARSRDSAREGLAMALALWTGAGLLRLCGGPSVSRIVVAAALVLIRRVVTASLVRKRGRETSPPAAARPSPSDATVIPRTQASSREGLERWRRAREWSTSYARRASQHTPDASAP